MLGVVIWETMVSNCMGILNSCGIYHLLTSHEFRSQFCPCYMSDFNPFLALSLVATIDFTAIDYALHVFLLFLVMNLINCSFTLPVGTTLLAFVSSIVI